MKKLMIAPILFFVFTLFSKSLFAFNVEDECQIYFHKPCGEVTKKEIDKECTMDGFILDAKGKIIGSNVTKEVIKINNLVVKETEIGCTAAVISEKYYFNKEIDLKKLTCAQGIKLWKDVLGNKSSCIAAEPERILDQEGCYLKTFTDECPQFNTRISIKKSDVVGYKFFIEEVMVQD